MSLYLPDGCTDADVDRAAGGDHYEPDDPENDPSGNESQPTMARTGDGMPLLIAFTVVVIAFWGNESATAAKTRNA